LFEGGFEVVGDFLGGNVGIGDVVGFFQAFISESEDIEAMKTFISRLSFQIVVM